MSNLRMYGVVIPTITPLTQEGEVDVKSVQNYTKFLIKAGVHCLYPNGTNGESLVLKEEERKLVAQTMCQANNHALPLFIQCGSMSTKETIAHVKHAAAIGADGAGVMTPAFFPMDEQALYEYYSDVVAQAPKDFPLYVYNIPGCTGNDVSPRLLGRLLDQYPQIKGIKYSCPDLMRIEDYARCALRKPDILIGCDSLFLQCLSCGGVGTVTGPGAVFHKKFTRLYKQYTEGDFKGAQETQAQIVKIDRALAGIPGIPALKAMLKLIGVIETDVCRKPLRQLTDKEYDTLKQVLDVYDKEENGHD